FADFMGGPVPADAQPAEPALDDAAQRIFDRRAPWLSLSSHARLRAVALQDRGAPGAAARVLPLDPHAAPEPDEEFRAQAPAVAAGDTLGRGRAADLSISESRWRPCG